METPFQSFGGEELYPTIQAKAARLGYGLIENHCMIDGNKRIGTHAMLVFLALNGIEEEESTLSDASTVFQGKQFFVIFCLLCISVVFIGKNMTRKGD